MGTSRGRRHLGHHAIDIFFFFFVLVLLKRKKMTIAWYGSAFLLLRYPLENPWPSPQNFFSFEEQQWDSATLSGPLST